MYLMLLSIFQVMSSNLVHRLSYRASSSAHSQTLHHRPLAPADEARAAGRGDHAKHAEPESERDGGDGVGVCYLPCQFRIKLQFKEKQPRTIARNWGLQILGVLLFSFFLFLF